MATILVVDDRPSNRQFLLTLLGYSGHSLIEAADGAEALRLTEASHPDLVITDILMPTMDGYEFVNRLRATPELAATPVIFYTATYSEPQANQLAASCGVRTVLPKPSEPERILDAVNRELAGGAPAPAAPADAAPPGDKSRFGSVDDAVGMYVRDLQGVKVQFDEIVRHSAALPSERDRVKALSKQFSDNVARLQRITSRLSALIEVGLAMNSERDPQRLVHLFFAAACDLVDARIAAVGILDEEEHALRHVFAKGVDPTILRYLGGRGDGVLASLLEMRKTIRTHGAPPAAGLDPQPLLTGHPPVESLLALSIASPDRIYGWIYFADKAGAREFTEEDERLAAIMATELAMRYEHAMLYDVIQRHATSLQLEVSERRRAQEALLESEGRFRQLAENIREVFWLTDESKHEMLYVSPAYEQVWQRSVASLYASPREWVEAIHPDDRERVLKAAQTRQASGDYDEEYRILRPDGSVRWIRDRAFPVRDGGRQVLRLAGVAEDITERKRATDELREAERRYRAIFENSVDGILQSTIEGHVLSVNPATSRMLGYASPAEFSATVGDFETGLYVDAADRRRFFELLHAKGVVHGFETRFKRKDGKAIWVSVSASIETDEREGSVYVLASLQDVTHRRQQEDKIERLTRVYAVLSGINAAIVRIRNREVLFRESCRIAVEAGRFALAYICVVDPTGERLVPAATAGPATGFLDEVAPRLSLRDDNPEGHGPPAIAVRERRAVIVNDVQTDARVRYKTAHTDRGIHAIAALPLLLANEPVAVLGLHSREAGSFDDDELHLLLELAGDISFALEHIHHAEKLDYLALYDSLTGLANRALFLDRLGQRLHLAAQSGERIAVVLADVERLSTINDSLGRQAGDALLKHLADRLTRRAPREELARTTADHFALVLPNVKDEADVAQRLERLTQESLQEPFRIDGSDLRIAVRVGIALYPKDASDPETLLRNAEAALRRAKRPGERFMFHTPEMTEQTAAKLSFENSLRRALENDEFVLHYQPKLDLQTGRITGAEALLRWQSPQHGLVPPSRFIPLLEETGLILDVGAWAIRRAVRDHRQWAKNRAVPPRVAVNVSSLQLRRRDFVDVVTSAIAQGGNPTGIDIEITESMIMDDVAGNTKKLGAVRDLGVRIAIDDFGTGYSSLGYLAKLPLHSIKVDRTFVIAMLNDPDTMTLVSTIISLAHSLRLAVVAEGVETEEHAKMLRLLRCDEIQGYLVSRPLPVEEFVPLLRAN